MLMRFCIVTITGFLDTFTMKAISQYITSKTHLTKVNQSVSNSACANSLRRNKKVAWFSEQDYVYLPRSTP